MLNLGPWTMWVTSVGWPWSESLLPHADPVFWRPFMVLPPAYIPKQYHVLWVPFVHIPL